MIMSYEAFKIIIGRDLIDFYPVPNKSDYEVVISKVNKTNKQLDALNIVPKETSDQPQMQPTIYVQQLFDELKNGHEISEIFTDAAQGLYDAQGSVTAIQLQSGLNEFFDVKSILPTLVNVEKNQSLLKDVPHKKFEDLAIIYKLHKVINGESCSSTINYGLMEHLNLTFSEVQKIAEDNLSNVKYSIESMSSVIKKMMIESGMPEELEEIASQDGPPFDMFVVSNKEKTNGAAVITNNEFMNEVSKKYDNSFYILPSSVHEVILVPESEIVDPNELRQMVREVNAEAVAVEDFLSDNLYKYDRELKKVELIEG